MPNNETPYITSREPIADGSKVVFSRTWFRFFDYISKKIKMFDGTQTTSATAGTNGAPPAQVAGYFTIIDSNGTPRKVPYYNE
jgi:hypothetical protein